VYNAVRHARPTSVRIALESERRRLRIVVSDDGRGFDPATVERSPAGHYGLVGMRERVEYLDGSLVVDSRPGQGTRIVIVVPVRRAHAAPKAEGRVEERG
jgi:two-component system sensor histidine kinase DegS